MSVLPHRARAFSRATVIIGICGLSASRATKPALYQELSSNSQLRVNGAQTDERVAFNTDFDPARLKSYSVDMIEPVQIHRGKDDQFGNLSGQAKADVARQARQYPNAFNIAASILPLDATKAGITHEASTTAGSLSTFANKASNGRG